MRKLLLMGIVTFLITVACVSASTKVTTIRPDGNGLAINWSYTCTVEEKCDHWQDVNDATPDNDSSYVYTSTNGKMETFTMQNLSEGSGIYGSFDDSAPVYVRGVQLFVVARKTLSSITAESIKIYPSSWTYWQLIIGSNVATTYNTYSNTFITIGTIGNKVAITKGDVNTLEIRLEDAISTRLQQMRATQVYAVVNWTYTLNCSGTADCIVNCSNDPEVVLNQSLNEYDINFTGSGKVTMNPRTTITNFTEFNIMDGCRIEATQNNTIG